MTVNIDQNSGFCWGVVRTIDIAEQSLAENPDVNVYVLGEIIHNPKETERLEKIGLKTITRDDFPEIAKQNAKVIIRAHGEPPETFQMAEELGIEVIDATCPLVTKLQDRIKAKYDEGWQIVIYGKNEHPEVIGLRGVSNNEAIVIKSFDEAMEKVDFSKKTILFSQTTMGKASFFKLKQDLEEKVATLIDGGELKDTFQTKNTLCHHVYGREDSLKQFCVDNDIILFVAGRHSSNGHSLYNYCKTINDRAYFIEDVNELDMNWFEGAESVGITGATSTPQWYMELVRDKLNEYSAEPVMA